MQLERGDEYLEEEEAHASFSSPSVASAFAATSVPNLAYPPSFKMEVALYARSHSQYAASKIFAVARRRIFDWLRQLPRLQELLMKGQARKATGARSNGTCDKSKLFFFYT